MNAVLGLADEARDNAPSHVVGLGASAGGLEALLRFFRAVPDRTGLAFVLVQHLSLEFKSMMPELLRRYTAMNIVPGDADVPLERDTVYVLVPGKQLALRGLDLHVQMRMLNGMPRSAIDTGCTDIVLEPESMPRALLDWLRDPDEARRMHLHPVEEPLAGAPRFTPSRL